jgi:hypothetical protein
MSHTSELNQRYERGVVFNGMASVPSFMKIYPLVQTLQEDKARYACDNIISLKHKVFPVPVHHAMKMYYGMEVKLHTF